MKNHFKNLNKDQVKRVLNMVDWPQATILGAMFYSMSMATPFWRGIAIGLLGGVIWSIFASVYYGMYKSTMEEEIPATLEAPKPVIVAVKEEIPQAIPPQNLVQ